MQVSTQRLLSAAVTTEKLPLIDMHTVLIIHTLIIALNVVLLANLQASAHQEN